MVVMFLVVIAIDYGLAMLVVQNSEFLDDIANLLSMKDAEPATVGLVVANILTFATANILTILVAFHIFAGRKR